MNLRRESARVTGVRGSPTTAARFGVVVIAWLFCGCAANAVKADDIDARVARVLAATPLIDGHNDLPMLIRQRFKGDLAAIDLDSDTAHLPVPPGQPPYSTDLIRLRSGQVGGQFWSVWVDAGLPGPEAVLQTIEQIDMVKRIVAAHPTELEMAYTASDIRRIHREKRVASLIGVEGGHQIGDSLAALRQFYALGARYLTLAHKKNTDWSDSASESPAHNGLTPFGREVVRESNRLGMMVDLSHVSVDVMRQAIQTSVAPVIFSHSSARALVDNSRNVPDDVLQLVRDNGGIVMVTFSDHFVSSECMIWEADRLAQRARNGLPPYGGLYLSQPARAQAAMSAWESSHPRPQATLAQVADHIEHIRDVAGIDHVGIGSDFEGIDVPPVGLEGVDRFPALLAELMRRGWSDKDVAKVAGENMLRVMSAVEAVSARLSRERGPSGATLSGLDGTGSPQK